MSKTNDCPYGASDCPKVADLRNKISVLEKNQVRLMRTVYYIAGIVSVTLGVQVII